MKKISLVLCILLCVLTLTGCNSIYKALSDGTEKIFYSASNAVGEAPKEAILNAFKALIEEGGSSLLTKNHVLQGERSVGMDDYTGSYSADYGSFSGTEILFGGTAVEREKGNTLTLNCSLNLVDGEAIIFWKTGDKDPVSILNATGEYSGAIDVGNGSNYIGIWGKKISGTVDLMIE